MNTQALEQIGQVGSYKGYKIYFDQEGFFLNGLNGLGQPKKIIFEDMQKMTSWIDEQLKAYGL